MFRTPLPTQERLYRLAQGLLHSVYSSMTSYAKLRVCLGLALAGMEA